MADQRQAHRPILTAVAQAFPGSTGLGCYPTGFAARFVGAITLSTGSATLQYRMGVNSGNYQVTSSTVINSGPSLIDFLNYGRHTDFAFTAINSQANVTLYLNGLPNR